MKPKKLQLTPGSAIEEEIVDRFNKTIDNAPEGIKRLAVLGRAGSAEWIAERLKELMEEEEEGDG